MRVVRKDGWRAWWKGMSGRIGPTLLMALILLIGVASARAQQPAAAPATASEGKVIDLNVGDDYIAVLMNKVKAEETYGVNRDGRFRC